MQIKGRLGRAVLAAFVAVAASGLGGCMHMAYLGAPGYDESHSPVDVDRDAGPARPQRLQPSPAPGR